MQALQKFVDYDGALLVFQKLRLEEESKREESGSNIQRSFLQLSAAYEQVHASLSSFLSLLQSGNFS